MDKPSFEKRPRAAGPESTPGPVPAPVDAPPHTPAPGPAAGAAPSGLRASDADRDRTADILREALAEGRLTAEEHGERIGAVYAARTLGELEPLVGDLPRPGGAARGSAPAHPRPYGAGPEGPESTENLVAVFGGAARKGRWRVPRRTNAFALFGGVEIDLTEAVFERRENVVNAVAVFGGVDIKVPENVTLRTTGGGIFGGFDVRTQEAPDPDAPVVSVTGFALFGGVEAKPRRGKRLKNLRAAG
ncbi:DUF1707 domain-containing protein [Streptomyces eurocidicus]|uniref:Cell wall-active antibiotics response LiaF-like C-terminal domain-containing protein n=1 Tax=Streptomyces eurocidicus TaxID=66423 RepID=A0A7W8B6I1_STREU|nr:hypothetical protein [Streptomyces eurocidicus]MBF6052462.1 DUF1707 domain-containing protein [Streptomyces eurocidicus]